MHVRLEVFCRPDLLDAQSKAVFHAIQLQGCPEVRGLRVGRLIDLDLDVPDRGAAQALVAQLAEALLVHPVTEDWRLQWPDDELAGSTANNP